MGVKLLVVGGGKMGSALLGGLLARGWAAPEEIGVVEPSADQRAILEAKHPGLTLTEALGSPGAVALEGSGGAVLAVKPEVAEAAARGLAILSPRRVLSIVAGVSSARLEACLPPPVVVVRAMPNTPALVGAGVSVLSGGDRALAGDLDWAEDLLGAVGKVLRLPERMLDAATGVSGCGPAYLFLVAEALIEAGVAVGLSRPVSRTLVVETLLGSARLLAETGEEPSALRAGVTSPAGATAAGLRALESRAVRSAFIEAVASATERSRNLAR